MLPLTHVSAQWRRAALGDSSLWTTIHLKQTTAPLLDMILSRVGSQLLTVHVDCQDLGDCANLWTLVGRIEELHYYTGLEQLVSFLSSLGPAPNLRVLHLRPEMEPAVQKIPIIFSGCLPSLRSLVLSNTIAWPTGLFRGLISFECGTTEQYPISLGHALDALRESPSIEFIRLVGFSRLPEGLDPPTIALPSLRKCILVGDGTTSLIRFIAAPATAVITLKTSYTDDMDYFPTYGDNSVAPGLRILGALSAVSFAICDHTIRLHAKNDCGGVSLAKVENLDDLSEDPINFINFIRSSFECWHTCPGLESAKDLTLRIHRNRKWGPREAKYGAHDLIRFISSLPGIERANFHGVPQLELSYIFGVLSRTVDQPCPNLKQLEIESSPLHTPASLLVLFSQLIAKRKGAGMPFQSVTVKIKCERLIPSADHCAFLAAWERLVEGDVRLEYERIEVGDEERDEKEGIGGPGDCSVGWGGWPQEWPRTVEEMKGR